MSDQQLIQKSNGVKRIKDCIKNCDLPVSEVGTMFPKKFTHIDLFEFEVFILDKIGEKLFERIFINGELSS
jgi:hypothetical protein